MNPLLQKTQDALLAKVDQRLVPVVNKVVNAGRKVMYSDASRGMAIQELKQATDPEGIGSAAAKMAGVLFNQSKQTIPMEVLFPATMLLMLEALDVSLSDSLAALGAFEPLEGRGAEKSIHLPVGAFTLIDESYNANPASMADAIDAFNGAVRPELPRLYVLGCMEEIEKFWHR